jgi:SAM-dependent methyltransferase
MTTTRKAYEHYQPGGKEVGSLPLVENCRVLEIGFGSGELLRELQSRGNDVFGIDVSTDIVEKAKRLGFKNVVQLDVSEQELPYEDDYFDAVYCYEVFEHLTNPHRMFCEIRRTLKREHHLYFGLPAQETDMGYGLGRHAFVYPGLMQKANLERFFMQMYFRVEWVLEPGPNDRLVGRSYVLKNMKSPDKPDIVEVVIGDYNVKDLYGDVLPDIGLQREVAREAQAYVKVIQGCANKGDWQAVQGIFGIVVGQYPDYYPMYFEIARTLHRVGQTKAAKDVLSILLKRSDVPETVLEEVKRTVVSFAQSSS